MNKTFCKSMKRATLFTLCAALLGTMPIVAQDNAPPPPPPQEAPAQPPPPPDNMAPPSQDNAAPPREGRRGRRVNGDRQMQRMTKELNLSPDQASQIKTINDDTAKQIEAVRSDSSVAQADKREKVMDIHKASEDKIRAVLNDDQKTKYDAMLAKHPRRGNRKGGDNATPPPPAPQQ